MSALNQPTPQNPAPCDIAALLDYFRRELHKRAPWQGNKVAIALLTVIMSLEWLQEQGVTA